MPNAANNTTVFTYVQNACVLLVTVNVGNVNMDNPVYHYI